MMIILVWKMNLVEYSQIFVVFEDCLGTIKSQSREQKNIADFMPDYNLWYALKFASPKKITIISNRDISRSPLSGYIDLELRFLSVWLFQVTEIYCNYGYSYHGDGKILFTKEDILDHYRVKEGNILFVDRDLGRNREYVESRKGIQYMKKDEFIQKYNKNPRIYLPQISPGRAYNS